MKMTKEHFNFLKSKLLPAQKKSKHTLEEYIKVGMSAERFGWDLIHSKGLIPWMCKTLYPYLNDAHIETALKRIIH